MADDDQAELAPQRMARHDAEIAADIGDDGPDRPAADFGRDLRRRGEAGETSGGRFGALGGRLGDTRGRWAEAARGLGAASRRASSAAARCRPRVMRDRIRAMSFVPKPSVAEARSLASVPCWNEAASCLP